MATILNGVSMPTRQAGPGGTMLTMAELAALERAPKRKGGTRVTVEAYPVKVGPIPLFGREHMFTRYDDGKEQYIFRGGPSLHGLHAQVDPARESPDYGRGRRIVHETEVPGLSAAQAAEPARRTARRIEDERPTYGVIYSNSNSSVGDQMEEQFGYRVGDSKTPGWDKPPRVTPRVPYGPSGVIFRGT